MNGWAIHGGRLSAARAAYPSAPQPWLDLSTGINPGGFDPLLAGAIDWRALPDEQALRGLESVAASYFGVAPNRVCAVPGTEIGLRLLGTIGLPAPFRHVAPGYRTHAQAFANSRAIDLSKLGDEVTRGGTILLANPNNPDGHIIDPGALIGQADRLRENGRLIIDEAFADAVPAASVLPQLLRDAPVIVLRSFGKFFGLAGLRLGFVIASEADIRAIRARIGSWPLSTAAIVIGTAAYGDPTWIEATRASLEAQAAALDAVLSRHGLQPTGGCPLFRLATTPDALTLFERLAREGILTRPFDYAPTWLRFGLPDENDALARLDRALARG